MATQETYGITMIARTPAPLPSSLLADLIPRHITTQESLNRWEESNIAHAKQWAKGHQDILSMWFVRELHRQMFNATWKWAGTFRSIDLNLGVNWPIINEEVKKLCDNTRYHIEHAIFSPDEIVLRFHYKMVSIHPFVNGNGRHARLIASLLITQLGSKPFHWGVYEERLEQTAIRKQYIEALQRADQGDYSKLITFARK